MAEEKRDEVSAEPEPWEGWERGLVRWSVIAGLVALVILGTLVNIFIL